LERVFIIIACIAMALVAVDNRGGGQQFFDALYTSIENTITLFVFIYVGLFGAMVMTFVQYLLNSAPLTFDTSRLYSPESWMAIALVIGIAAAGWWMARAGEPIFGRANDA
jgi:Mn2+/Fe2+ NRAMP family transporter